MSLSHVHSLEARRTVLVLLALLGVGFTAVEARTLYDSSRRTLQQGSQQPVLLYPCAEETPTVYLSTGGNARPPNGLWMIQNFTVGDMDLVAEFLCTLGGLSGQVGDIAVAANGDILVVDTPGNLRFIPAETLPAPSTNFSRTCPTTFLRTLQGSGSYSGLSFGFTSDTLIASTATGGVVPIQLNRNSNGNGYAAAQSPPGFDDQPLTFSCWNNTTNTGGTDITPGSDGNWYRWCSRDNNMPYTGTRFNNTCMSGTPRLVGAAELVSRGGPSDTQQANAGAFCTRSYVIGASSYIPATRDSLIGSYASFWAFGVTNGSRASSGLSVESLPQATLVARTRPVVEANGTIRLDGLRVNGAAVKPVVAPGNCVEQQPTGNGEIVMTRCSGAPTAPVANGAWPSNCAGAAVGATCSASCTYGGSATVTCQQTGQWSNPASGSCAAPPTSCAGVPSATVADGAWPANCAGAAIGATCSASCTYSGSATVNCLSSGQWNTSVTGSCAAPPTNCAGVPSVTVANGAWPAGCAGAAIGATCSASCTFGGSATVSCLASGQWDTSITGSCAAPPTSCAGVPTATVSNGAWPANCAGAAIGATCSASCTYGGSATVSCLASGQWDTSITGSCAAPPTSCAGVPSATVSNGAWPAGCAGAAIGATCSASCTYGGSATVNCLASGQWNTSVTGSCAAPPTSCSGVPTATVSNGAWPSNCAGAAIGATCSASCTYGGSATVNCLSSGQWNTSVTGSCTAAPTSCSGTPSTNPPYGTWPVSCSGTALGQTCAANCTFGGTVTATCQSNGTWTTTFSGSCTPGATALISESGLLPLGSDRLRVCTLVNGVFSNCDRCAGFNLLRASFAIGSTVWAADESANTISVCSLNVQTNAVTGCVASSLPGFSGTRDPVAVVVKNNVAFVANRDSGCGLIRCSDASTMSGCSCALTGAQGANTVRGISLSTDGDKLYFTTNTDGIGYGISVCAMNGTTLGSCTAYSTNTLLTGVYASSTKLYVAAQAVVTLLTYTRVWVCDLNTPDPNTCIKTGDLIGTGVLNAVLNNDPWALSVFDGTLYVPDNSAVRRCSPTNGGSCSSASGLLNLSPVLSGASSIFILPRI